MKTYNFSHTVQRPENRRTVRENGQRTLAVWLVTARACPALFEESTRKTAASKRHRTLQAWIDTGAFRMAVIRKASLDAHAAAREAGEDNAARSAARAQASGATAHVPLTYRAAIYALQAIARQVTS